MRRDELNELHFITLIDNVPSILTKGILSHYLAEKVQHRSIAMQEVQNRRSSKKVPGGRMLHEYVNTYRGNLNPADVCLVEILARIEREPFHWPVGRVIFQKIAYFATEAGVPTGLHFIRESYGPFSPEGQALITRLVNNGVIREVKLGNMLAIKPGPTYGDAVRAFRTDLEQWETSINRIADLFLRMHTHEAEVAATVHYTAQALQHESDTPVTELDIFEGVKLWKQRRKPPLQDDEIAQAIRDLNVLGWIHAQPSPNLPLPQEEKALLDA